MLFVSSAIALLPVMSASAQEAPEAPKSQNQATGQNDQGQNQAPAARKPAQKRAQNQKAPGKPEEKPEEAALPATSAGCGWIGKRVIHALLRDDAVTAQDFDRLYHTFTCSPEHLRASFDCTVAVGAPPTAAEAQTRVDSCWTDPKFDTNAMKIAPANETPTSNGAPAGAAAQPKSGAAKSAPPASGNSGGSTPNYPAPKPK
jgi:hypothetical protein